VWTIIPTKSSFVVLIYGQSYPTSIFWRILIHVSQVHHGLNLSIYFSFLPIRQMSKGHVVRGQLLSVNGIFPHRTLAQLPFVPCKNSLEFFHQLPHLDTFPSSLINSNVSMRWRQWKSKELGAHSLACSTLGVEGHARALGWD